MRYFFDSDPIRGSAPQILIFLLVIAISGKVGNAQTHSYATSSTGSPKVGLVLSGGGTRGLAHIGVLKVIEELGLPVDVVTGTSMGSVVGGLYASGYNAMQLENIALERDWSQIFDDRVDRRQRPNMQRRWDERFLVSIPIEGGGPTFPSGLLRGQRIMTMLSDLTLPVSHIVDFKDLPIPFAAVATNLTTGTAEAIDHGNLPTVIRASIALPSIFTPVEIDGNLYADGGIIRNLPAEDALELGADVLVCVLVSREAFTKEEMNSLVSVASQAILHLMVNTIEQQRELCDVFIHADLEGAATLGFGDVESVISQGEAAAREVRTELESLIASIGRKSTIRPGIEDEEVLPIGQLELQGVKSKSEQQYRSLFHLPGVFTRQDLQSMAEKMYGSGHFEYVSYQLMSLPPSKSSVLVINAPERNTSRLGAHLRFESSFRSSLLLGASWSNIGTSRGALHIDLRLGNALKGHIHYQTFIGRTIEWGLQLSVQAKRLPYSVFLAGVPSTTLKTDIGSVSALPTVALGQFVSVSAGIVASLYRTKTDVGDPQTFRQENKIWGPQIEMHVDSFDQSAFPRQGQQIIGRAFFSNSSWGSGLDQKAYFFKWEGRWPLYPRLSLLHQIALVSNKGMFDLENEPDKSVPIQTLSFLGGAFGQSVYGPTHHRLLGYDYQQLPGLHSHVIELGIQTEIVNNGYVLARWNMGYGSFEAWQWNPSFTSYKHGFGISFGYRVLDSPLELTIMKAHREKGFGVKINIGPDF